MPYERLSGTPSDRKILFLGTTTAKDVPRVLRTSTAGLYSLVWSEISVRQPWWRMKRAPLEATRRGSIERSRYHTPATVPANSLRDSCKLSHRPVRRRHLAPSCTRGALVPPVNPVLSLFIRICNGARVRQRGARKPLGAFRPQPPRQAKVRPFEVGPQAQHQPALAADQPAASAPWRKNSARRVSSRASLAQRQAWNAPPCPCFGRLRRQAPKQPPPRAR